jgi:hypothetical protein
MRSYGEVGAVTGAETGEVTGACLLGKDEGEVIDMVEVLTLQLSVPCPVAFNNTRAEPAEDERVSKEHTSTVRVPEQEQLL